MDYICWIAACESLHSHMATRKVKGLANFFFFESVRLSPRREPCYQFEDLGFARTEQRLVSV